MSKARAELNIQGLVQGVFYRQSAMNSAIRLGLTGWAKNCLDGSVDAVLEGEKDKIETMIRWCRQGPPAARVTAVRVDWFDFQDEFSNFEVRP